MQEGVSVKQLPQDLYYPGRQKEDITACFCLDFRVRDSGFGIRDSGFGIRDSGFGFRV